MDEKLKEMDSLKSTRKPKKRKAPTFGMIKCSFCSKQFDNRRDCQRHETTHSDETPFACSICAYASKSQSGLYKHIKVFHVNDRKFRCDVCGMAFHYDCKLKTHMRIHTGEKPYKCEECGKSFNSSYSLSGHRFIHTGAKPFKCSFCPYACRDSSTLRKHQARHMGTEKIYQCKMCDITVKDKWKLKMHVAEKHLNVEVKTMECDACGKKYKQRQTLVRHIQTVHDRSRTVKCALCGFVLANRANLATHMRTHTAQRPYACDVTDCKLRFKDSSSLRKHLITHFPAKHLPCEICRRRFATKSRLDRHMSTHQPKVKKVQCDYCDVRFYGKNYLINHIKRKHSRKKKKYICDMCDFETTNKPSIVMHIKYGHVTNNEIPCKMCEKKFKRDFNLKLHYWTAHGIKYKIEYKKKPKKPVVIVKQEPIEEDMVDTHYMEITPKIEPLDDGEIPNDVAPSDNKMEDIPKELYDEFINTFENRPSIELPRRKRKYNADKKLLKQADKAVKKLLARQREKTAAAAMERTRRKYNRLMRKAVINITERSQKTKNDNNNIVKAKSLLVEHYSISNAIGNKTTDKGNKIIDNADSFDREAVEVVNKSKTADSIEAIDKESANNEETTDSAETNKKTTDNVEKTTKENADSSKTDQSGKVNLNMHQCYVCFKLFETKQILLDHCKDHFDMCTIKTLKKCPFCDYATNLSVTRHLKRKHDIDIKIPYGTFKEDSKKNDKDSSRYYYDVGDERIAKVEIIPSIKNLNRRELMKIDKKRRDDREKGLAKPKLIKKGDEWIVVREKLQIKDYMLPKFDKVGDLNVKGGYIERLKVLSRMAKKKGIKMLFPCNSCDKVCQTAAALKLHDRKHQANPKPFAPKIWKHKANVNDRNCNKKGARSKTSRTQRDNLGETASKVKNQEVVSTNRTAKPQPVTTKHRCRKELIEFYENNIKGGDIEFWQFLKIYNKMGRENVNDFGDLEKIGIRDPEIRNDIDNSEENRQSEEDATNSINDVRSKEATKVPVKKTVRNCRLLSRKEIMRRNEIREKLREKIRNNCT